MLRTAHCGFCAPPHLRGPQTDSYRMAEIVDVWLLPSANGQVRQKALEFFLYDGIALADVFF